MRSGGAIAFPAQRQCGYVWFDSRLYGHAPGQVYGHKAWPWLHRTAATVDGVNVDRVLAHGDNAFHVILLNQVHTAQAVQVRFDAAALGRPVEDAPLAAVVNGRPAAPVPLRDGVARLELPALGLAVLTLEGTRIDVPTHRAVPPAGLAWPGSNAVIRAALPGTRLESVGTLLQVPPVTWRVEVTPP